MHNRRRLTYWFRLNTHSYLLTVKTLYTFCTDLARLSTSIPLLNGAIPTWGVSFYFIHSPTPLYPTPQRIPYTVCTLIYFVFLPICVYTVYIHLYIFIRVFFRCEGSLHVVVKNPAIICRRHSRKKLVLIKFPHKMIQLFSCGRMHCLRFRLKVFGLVGVVLCIRSTLFIEMTLIYH